MPALPLGNSTQFFVELRVDKSGVRVVLHQAVDFLLSGLEARCCGLVEALNDGVLSVEIQVDLQ